MTFEQSYEKKLIEIINTYWNRITISQIALQYHLSSFNLLKNTFF